MVDVLAPASAGTIPIGERIERLAPSRIPARRDGFIPFASNPVVHGAIRAMLAPREAWKQEDYEQPMYVHRTEGRELQGYTLYTIIVPTTADEEPAGVVTTELAWDMQKRFGVDTAWLHMMLCAYASDRYKPDLPGYGKYFAIDREQIIRTLGIPKVSRAEQDARARSHIEALRSINVERIDLDPIYIKADKAWFNFARLERHGLWDINVHECGQLYWDVGGNNLTRGETWQLKGREGLWATVFLTGQDSLRQLGWLSPEQFKSLDRRDGRTSPWPHILTIELAFRTRFLRGNPVRLTNEDVIRLCGGNVAATTRRECYDTRIRVENALQAVEGYDCVPDFSEWPCELWPVPTPEEMNAADEAVNDDGADASSRVMPRGYWNKWLHCRTTFTMPAAVALANAVHRELPAPKPKPALTGEDVRRLREAQGMTQGAFADLLGVTQQFISSVEKGKRVLKAQQQKQLRAIQQTVV